MSQPLLIVFILGFSSGLPLALVSSTLQAWFASSGLSVLATTLLSLISIPYAYRFFWGPILDRYPLFTLGKRRSWILTMQVLLCFGFNLMAWFNPEQHPQILAALGLILACCSATQDTAIDAHRAEYLATTQQALGASFAVFGYRLALLFSGGFALILAERVGWALTYRVMGFSFIIGMLAILCSEEPPSINIKEQKGLAASFAAPIKELLARPGIIYLFLFIFCFKLGEAFTTTTSGVVMPFLIQGLGFSLQTIGYVNKILGITSILLGGLVAGFLLLRYNLYRSLFFFGLLQALTNFLFVILALHEKSTTLLAFAVFSDNFAAGAGSTALVALMMRLVNKQYTGTQFALLVSLSTLPRIVSGPIAASLQMTLGWAGLYQLSVVFALAFIPFLILIKEQVNERPQQTMFQGRDLDPVL